MPDIGNADIEIKLFHYEANIALMEDDVEANIMPYTSVSIEGSLLKIKFTLEKVVFNPGGKNQTIYRDDSIY